MTSAGILTTPARFPRLLLPATPAHNPLDIDEAIASGAFTACAADDPAGVSRAGHLVHPDEVAARGAAARRHTARVGG